MPGVRTMIVDGYEKTREEILKERADVLSNAGRAVSDVLEKMDVLERSINDKLDILQSTGEPGLTADQVDTINREIQRYNTVRKQAQLRYYYLIVTREALGLRKHTWVEKLYRVPPCRKPLDVAVAVKAEETTFDGQI